MTEKAAKSYTNLQLGTSTRVELQLSSHFKFGTCLFFLIWRKIKPTQSQGDLLRTSEFTRKLCGKRNNFFLQLSRKESTKCHLSLIHISVKVRF